VASNGDRADFLDPSGDPDRIRVGQRRQRRRPSTGKTLRVQPRRQRQRLDQHPGLGDLEQPASGADHHLAASQSTADTELTVADHDGLPDVVRDQLLNHGRRRRRGLHPPSLSPHQLLMKPASYLRISCISRNHL
jgi:hypothetical protein